MLEVSENRPLFALTQYELNCECDDCECPDGCGQCQVLKEREYRLWDREQEVKFREIDCDIRETNFGQDRDVYHNGSIIKGGGVSKPEWMDDDEYSEYKMSAEYAHEVSYVSDSMFDEPDYENDYYDEEY